MRKRKNKSFFSKLILLGNIYLLLVSLSLRIEATNAYFTVSGNSAANSISAGWWVEPSVAVNSPNGSETWYQENTATITWTATSSDPGATVDIDLYYSTDGGATYPNTIATGEANDGSYDWIVPSIFSDTTRIKVVATDSYGLINEDESDANFSIKSGIVLNEFLPNPSGDDDAAKPAGEWVELYNNGTSAIDVNGWTLYDALDDQELVISAGNSDNNSNTEDAGETIVPAGGFLVVYRDGDGDFSLNNTGGDTVRLYNGAIGVATLIDSYAYATDASAGKSFARIPDGTGVWVDPIPTPGKPNVLGEVVDTLSPTPTPELTPESTPSVEPIASPSATPEPSFSPEPTEVPEPIPSPEPTPTAEPTPEASQTPVPTPTPEETDEPTPAPLPTEEPSPEASVEPTPAPEPEENGEGEGV